MNSNIVINETKIHAFIDKYKINNFILEETNQQFINEISDHLKRQKMTLSLAESCTGGLLSSLFTDIPGSSLYLKAGIIAYSKETKINILKVKESTLKKHSIYSTTVAQEMAQGVRNITNSDVAIATTGVAGPSGAELPDFPIGTISIALTDKNNKNIKLQFSLDEAGQRLAFKKKFCNVVFLVFHAYLFEKQLDF